RLRVVEPVDRVQGGDEPDDLGGGNDVALAGARIPVQHVAALALLRGARGRREERADQDEQGGGEGARASDHSRDRSARNDACSTQMAPPIALSSMPPTQHGIPCSAHKAWMARDAASPPTRAILMLTTLQLPRVIAART